MEEEDLSERGLPQIASIMSRVRDLKNKYKNEDNVTDELTYTKLSADTTDNSGTVNQIMMTTNNPEDWLSFLLRLEKKGIPQMDVTLLNRLIGRYSQAVTALPAEKHSQDESYARILVRFAELKALQDPEEARDQFHLARLNCKKFAFVHVAFAQFELSQGNMKKCKQLLQKAVDCCAVPLEMLETALRNFHSQKKQLLSDEKENFAVSSTQASGLQNVVGNYKSRKRNDSENSSTATLGGEKSQEFDAILNCHNPLRPLNKSNQACPFGRVPVKLITDTADLVKKVDIPLTASVMKRQISSLKSTALIAPFPLSEPKSSGDDSYDLGDLKSLEDKNSVQLQMLDEDSLETPTSSTVTLKTKMDASLATKREENKVQYQELKIPEPRGLESQQQQSSSAEGYRKQIDRIKLSCVNSRRKWPVQEVTQKSCFKEGKQSSFEQPSHPILKGLSPPDAVSKKNDPLHACGTPSTMFNDYMDCFRTPVVKNDFPPGSQISTPYSQLPYFLPHTPATPFQNQIGLQVSASIPSNECLAIKGKVYTILKQIGSGGSSKVFQVLNEKKQLYAVKYVNLEEADQQTVESYKNEIGHLSKLQQHSDKIIRLYGYVCICFSEITEHHIYMVMECGNIDLNSWLKKKKNIDPLERKSYWKNMLEAVHTIHEYGIIHSDLKPANFLIVDGMLKLIDFGIANQMQPDVTSIVKDSQVGTMNYMPPEAIKDMSSYGENGKSRSKISPKSDVWSLGCILYCMTYGRTPFQHITNPINKLHAIIDPSYEIEFPDIAEKDLQDVLKRCLIRNPKQRISVSELLIHPYVQIQTHSQTGVPNAKGMTEEMKHILGQLVGLNSPNSISRAARTLYEQCNSGKSLDVSAFAKPGSQKSRTTK
ncbi:dual specificity protein kinase TTK isoform X1 [Apteryx rowi]|uniref:dual specificity protein kinase TTK isoform X1 n=1 Tax=Apteryx rowi TaxID=308060 RepID=UPI000E1D50AE|nr:dual specificity protein kinase TTK isoform X1 [Apteryx rowi]XP_025945261.1 dual specificity protein kinase TTK isoform X1 [Apteryx rowi]XP_025945262.1 dual specificity protein kinase TTK isoform X1 [Apteryx rowi]XP_025945263.1 dual specificity protein kinase TTK isoform X1 [Apteryx rowi]XP_025945265.1 dual specificity protein kinase TTK isoform X1 [Apteryx rowi]XP_025945266.1 dual specificity protein kinase TTK isoform X1 [Apteryx rowi]